jgi:hypothetical protein
MSNRHCKHMPGLGAMCSDCIARAVKRAYRRGRRDEFKNCDSLCKQHKRDKELAP